MVEIASLEFRLRKIDETRNYLVDEIKYNDLISKKDQKIVSKYVERLLILTCLFLLQQLLIMFQFLQLLHSFVFILLLRVLQ